MEIMRIKLEKKKEKKKELNLSTFSPINLTIAQKIASSCPSLDIFK